MKVKGLLEPRLPWMKRSLKKNYEKIKRKSIMCPLNFESCTKFTLIPKTMRKTTKFVHEKHNAVILDTSICSLHTSQGWK